MIFFVFLVIIVLCFLVYSFTKPFVEHESIFCGFIAGVSFVFVVITIAISVIWIFVGVYHNTEVCVGLERKKIEVKMAISFVKSGSLGNDYCPIVVKDAYKSVAKYNKALAKYKGLEKSFLWSWAIPSNELKRHKFIDVKKELKGIICRNDKWSSIIR